jgi:RimJ/RimL family protein N-acetyltransferase
MTTRTDRPVGPIVDPLPPNRAPDLRRLPGETVTLEPVSVERHGDELWVSMSAADPVLMWSYMPYGPWPTKEAFTDWLKGREAARDPWFYAYIDNTSGTAVGMGAFMRFDGPNGTIELGNIWFSPALQKTRAATEAIFVMMKHAFDDLQVRRLEWKCDALNAPSRAAAKRFGFSFEGIFRQHYIIKGRNRDTAWFGMIDKEWPQVRKAFEAWLNPANFDANGQQKAKLQVA